MCLPPPERNPEINPVLANFAISSHWGIFYLTNSLLFCVNDYIKDMATLSAIQRYMHVANSCPRKLLAMGKLHVHVHATDSIWYFMSYNS
jgi:hypothetical protein